MIDLLMSISNGWRPDQGLDSETLSVYRRESPTEEFRVHLSTLCDSRAGVYVDTTSGTRLYSGETSWNSRSRYLNPHWYRKGRSTHISPNLLYSIYFTFRLSSLCCHGSLVVTVSVERM